MSLQEFDLKKNKSFLKIFEESSTTSTNKTQKSPNGGASEGAVPVRIKAKKNA